MLHACIVEALEALAGDRVAEQVEHLAHHALRAKVWEKSLAYCRQAGEKALARSAYREAVGYFEQALSVLPHLPETRATREQAIDLRLALRHALYPLGEFDRLLVCLQDAHALAEALGDHHRLGWISASLLAHCTVVCDPDGAFTAGQRALALATTLGDGGLTVTAQYYLGIVSYSLGGYRRAVDYAQKNLACLHGALLQEHFGLPGRAPVLSRGLLVYALAECGAFDEARAPAEEGVRMAEAADHPYSRFLAYWAMSFRVLRQGDLRQAIPALERTFTFAQGAHIQLGVHVATAALGAAYALAGRTADALPRLEQAVEQALAMRFCFDHALRVVWLGEAYLRAGRLDEADSQAQRALEFSRAHQERGHEASALRLLGEVAAQRTPPEVVQATAHYRHALALAEELDMGPLQAHCHRGLGTLYAAIGQAAQARVALSTAIAMYQAMAMTFWLPETEAALAQVEA